MEKKQALFQCNRLRNKGKSLQDSRISFVPQGNFIVLKKRGLVIFFSLHQTALSDESRRPV
jgi:hypothetical protein